MLGGAALANLNNSTGGVAPSVGVGRGVGRGRGGSGRGMRGVVAGVGA